MSGETAIFNIYLVLISKQDFVLIIQFSHLSGQRSEKTNPSDQHYMSCGYELCNFLVPGRKPLNLSTCHYRIRRSVAPGLGAAC